ncbi:sensor histidine kinase [Gulosibacter chungangensis]|nr:ATP-binding protein [Gulosibacter chungangensis]
MSVWRWQLIFAGSILAITVMVLGLRPEVFAAPTYLAGLVTILAATITVLALPWEYLSARLVFAVPLVDALAIGLMTNVPDIRFGMLWVFPVVWVAMYYSMRHVLVILALVTACLIQFGHQTRDPSDMLLRALVVSLTLCFLGATVNIGARRARASRRLLRRQAEQIGSAAERAKAHRQRVTQIIDSLDIALVAVTDCGTIIEMNDAYRRLYGRDHKGTSLSSTVVEYDDWQGEPLAPEQRPLARAARGETLKDERIWLFDAEGQWHALEVSTEPMASVTGDAHTTLLIMNDITAALAAAEERRTVATIVTHELRNPLTAILGHVDLLLEQEDLPEPTAKKLEIIASAAERMQRLVSATLDQTRSEAQLLSEPVDLRQLSESSIASFLPTAEQQGLSLDIEGADTLPIYGDAFRLRQVFDNLLSNAVKYTPEGGHIAVRLGASAEGEAEVTIADTGTGIAPADVDRIFQRYYRSQDALDSGIPGTGLGMNIVREIVTAHEGTLEIKSDLGEGTCITLRFPRQPITKETA